LFFIKYNQLIIVRYLNLKMQELEYLLEKYKNKKPEIVFEWNDSETEAHGWIVINSLKNGAAGGGTRMRKGLTKDEVISLAKVMEIKFSVAGPSIGGAKSGINFDPNDPRRIEVLTRWYKAVLPLLKNYYGTGGDLNVDELKDVVPITEDLGLWHPQEGIVKGHLKPTEGQHINIIGQLRYGCSKIVEDPEYVPESGGKKYAVADLITGYGVAEAVGHFYKIYHNRDLVGRKAIIQGWGNVASAAACYLAKEGVKIVGIIDREGGLINPKGYSLEEIKNLFAGKSGNKLVAENQISFSEANDKIWDLGAQIFIPGAASKLVTRNQIDRLISGGLEVISCGANVPFVDDDVFFGDTAHYTDEMVALIPDFIANCGMARTFAYLMQPDISVTDKSIFSDISNTIFNALNEIKKNNPKPTKISQKALHLALEKVKF
jgi:glutamate dehydrogenase/leucine dehydrogenase